MSASLDGNASVKHLEGTKDGSAKDNRALATPEKPANGDYKGFVAGVFSGIAKLSVGHPFDTIKVRMQTSTSTQFNGPLDCLMQTLRKEGPSGLYKGATPPLLGWMAMDSLMLGSLTLYRRLLNENLFNRTAFLQNRDEPLPRLPTLGHALAGILAGSTVSLIAAPVEHIKARLQIQYAAQKHQRLYSGPIDCTRNIFRGHGIRGLYHGLSATLMFRGFFFFWWGSYDLITRGLQYYTTLSNPSINFWAGGLSAQVFWLTCYPTDVVKQRIMTDGLGPERSATGSSGSRLLGPSPPGRIRSGAGPLTGHAAGGSNVQKYARWKDAARAVYREGGWRGFWRGFLPCFLRSFPANAAALTAFEAVMRGLP